MACEYSKVPTLYYNEEVLGLCFILYFYMWSNMSFMLGSGFLT